MTPEKVIEVMNRKATDMINSYISLKHFIPLDGGSTYDTSDNIVDVKNKLYRFICEFGELLSEDICNNAKAFIEAADYYSMDSAHYKIFDKNLVESCRIRYKLPSCAADAFMEAERIGITNIGAIVQSGNMLSKISDTAYVMGENGKIKFKKCIIRGTGILEFLE